MKLPIERWLEVNHFSEDANLNVLFRDSIICYKVGACRASLLFSYLGFLTILKQRVLNSKKPHLFPQQNWEDYLTKLRNDDKWEEGIFDATQKKEKKDSAKTKTEDAIFPISDNLRLQIRYWKDRRNDCAHFKNNEIGSFHVEGFWAFIQSNLTKLTVEGGMSTLLNKLQKHYDTNHTSPNQDVSYLIREIEYSVEEPEMEAFFEAIENCWYLSDYYHLEIYDKIILINNEKIQPALISFLKKKPSRLLRFLSKYPNRILTMNYKPNEIRHFWKQTLLAVRSRDILPLSIYAALLSNNLIVSTDIQESGDTIMNHLIEENLDYTDNPTEHGILFQKNFFLSVKKHLFFNKDFYNQHYSSYDRKYLWVNERADLIASIIKNYPADNEVITILCKVYDQPTNSDWLLNRFDKIFTPENPLTQQYKDMVTQNNITVPSKLQKYFGNG